MRDHVQSASALSAFKKKLVAILSAKRQLSVAKLSAKRIFSLAKRDFLVANGRMAADFSSPERGERVLMPEVKLFLRRSIACYRELLWVAILKGFEDLVKTRSPCAVMTFSMSGQV